MRQDKLEGMDVHTWKFLYLRLILIKSNRFLSDNLEGNPLTKNVFVIICACAFVY